MRKSFAAAALVLLSCSASFADIARPDGTRGRPVPKPKPSAQPTADAPADASSMEMQIRIDDGVAEPTLVISRAALDRLASAAAGKGSVSSTVPFGTVGGGILLSLAIVSGGMFAARSKTRASRVLGLLMVIAAAGGATAVFADLAPPRSLPISEQLFAPDLGGYAHAKGRVKIVIVETGQDLNLLVPRKKD